MASALQQAVAAIQETNYSFFVTITAVAYDYILTFSWEIEYIWKRPWTWVSTLFVMTRYSGICDTILLCIGGSSSFRGSGKMYVPVLFNISTIIWQEANNMRIGEFTFAFNQWCLWIFQLAAELAMILRVWALYNRSILVLGTLLALYAMELILLFASYAFFESQPSRFEMETVQVLQYSVCVFTKSNPPKWSTVSPAAIQIALGAVMCLLAAIRLIQELLQTYKATKRLELNPYVECLVREGMIYFVVVLAFSIYSVLINPGNFAPGGPVLGNMIDTMFPVTLVPRFILNLRKLYARDVLGGREGAVDTGFGLGSEFERGAARSAIAFADPRRTESEEQVDEVEMEVQEVTRTSGLA